MSLKAKVEAIIYAADEPVTLDQIATVLKDDLQADLRSAASAQGEEPAAAAEVNPAEAGVAEAQNDEKARAKQERAHARHHIRNLVEKLMAEYAAEDRGIEVREVAGGYRMST